VKINTLNQQKVLPVSLSSLKKIVRATLAFKKVTCREVSVYLVRKETIQQIHRRFFEDPSPTDCISFPCDPPSTPPCLFLGEVFACPEIAVEYAKKHRLDPYLELTLYIVHGLLHLIGFDDKDKKSRLQMQREEKSCLHFLRKNGLLLEVVAKLHDSEKSMILGHLERQGYALPNHADGGLPSRAGEEAGSQEGPKGRFCALKSFATASLT